MHRPDSAPGTAGGAFLGERADLSAHCLMRPMLARHACGAHGEAFLIVEEILL